MKALIKEWVENIGESQLHKSPLTLGDDIEWISFKKDELLEFIDSLQDKPVGEEWVSVDSDLSEEDKIRKDLICYGQSFQRITMDGEITRIDPMNVYITPPKEG